MKRFTDGEKEEQDVDDIIMHDLIILQILILGQEPFFNAKDDDILLKSKTESMTIVTIEFVGDQIQDILDMF